MKLPALALVVGAVCLGQAMAGSVAATSDPASTLVHRPDLSPNRPVATVKAARPPHADPARKPSHSKASVKSRAGRLRATAGAPSRSEGVALADCYGRFIGWRDQLAALMLQANSYTPWPDDKIRFDRLERAFAAGVMRERKLVLTLQPTFKESDFPADIRGAFRTGLKRSAALFADNAYQHTQILVIGQPELSPLERMAQLEANADQAFTPLAGPCERLIGD